MQANPQQAPGQGPPAQGGQAVPPPQTSEQSLSGILNSVRGVKREMNGQTEQLIQMSHLISSQSISTFVKEFSGKPAQFRDWVRQVEKYVQLNQLPTEKAKFVAYQTATGVVSDFIGRFLEEERFEDRSWATLKAQLRLRFGEIQDEQHALVLLQKLRQKQKETCAVYGERIFILAKDAFPDDMELPPVQRQLVSIFTDGVCDKNVKMKVLRKSPPTLQEAITIANDEEVLRKRFELRTGNVAREDNTHEENGGHEPMEIGHARPLRCFKCNKRGHRASQCKSFRQIQEVRRNVTCYFCGMTGHIQRNCRRFLSQNQGN